MNHWEMASINFIIIIVIVIVTVTVTVIVVVVVVVIVIVINIIIISRQPCTYITGTWECMSTNLHSSFPQTEAEPRKTHKTILSQSCFLDM